MEEISHTHIVGCGDIGRRVGRLFLDKGLPISGSVRSEASQIAATKTDIACFHTDLEQDASPIIGKLANKPFSLFYFVPPPSDAHSKLLVDTRLSAFLETLKNKVPNKFVLISTTGVYGDCHGNWVDETAPIQAISNRALRRINAEQQLITWASKNNVNYVILRVPGIYAKDRLPLRRLISGEPIVCADEAPWTNRIHADDLAQACLLAMTSSTRNEIINICDDQPSTMTDYFNAVADYAGLPRPAQIPLAVALKTLSAGMQSYLQESRRIDNSRMKLILGLQLKYPNLAAGLSS